ncbi:MAG: hypothetical protein RLZZ369_224 [Pseudomonadota bacterium]|jgi:hypothetical protein
MRKPLLLALAVALAATLWVASQDDGGTVEAVKSSGAAASPANREAAKTPRPAPRAPAPSVAAQVPSDLPRAVVAWRQREPIGLKDDSQLKAWGPSLPPPPVIVSKVDRAQEAPKAPRFPHAWVGRFNDMVVVAGPQSTWVLAEGQVIEGQWRVDQIRDRQMQLTYLPFQQVQTVAMQTP